ncbi:MAG: DUF2207 domain-containing protein [Phycisphaerales bacterium]|nr:DUF2207 domain-containing protein [Phycisphaerales bacterium]
MRGWFSVSGLVALLLVLLAPHAWGQGLDWDIDSFDVEVEVGPDASMLVRERIVADFSREAHHGIFREIPYRYRRAGSSFDLRLAVVSVEDGQGHPRRWARERRGGKLRLRIGDADQTLTGLQEFVVVYRVERGLLSFDTHDELYWNVTGTEWPVPIERASCTVTLPGAVDAASIRSRSYLGAFGTGASGPEPVIAGREVEFRTGVPLREWEGLTVVVGWAPGAITFPDWTTRAGWFVTDNGVLVAPVLTALLMLLLWRVFGRDRGAPGPIVVQYSAPDGLSPLEVGTLIDERVDTRDVTAALVGLAVRGYLRIDASGAAILGSIDAKDVVLWKLREADRQLTDAERMLLGKVFAEGKRTSLSDLQHKFYAQLPDISRKTYDALVVGGYFASSPSGVRGAWMVMGVLWAIAWVLLAVAVVKSDAAPPIPWIIAAVLGAPQLLVLAPHMPRRTAKGRRALEAVKGLEEYVVRAERRELEERAAKDGFQAHFESLLPYALAFGLVERWGEKFEGLFTPEPGWYVGPSGSPLSASLLAMQLGRTTGSMGTAMTSLPRSSGGSSSGFGGGGSGFSGGFSGGGGGGGGGGAW